MQTPALFPDMVQQNFDLPTPFMRYIVEEAIHHLTTTPMNKLSASCRFFCNLYLSNIENFKMEDMEIECLLDGRVFTLSLAAILRFGLVASRRMAFISSSNSLIISRILSKIPPLRLEELTLVGTSVSYSDFLVLTESQTIKSLSIDPEKIGFTHIISVSMILSRVPNATFVR